MATVRSAAQHASKVALDYCGQAICAYLLTDRSGMPEEGTSNGHSLLFASAEFQASLHMMCA